MADPASDPLAPVEKHSFACGVCSKLKDSENEARDCALEDTKQISIEKIVSRDPNGYPKVFNGIFRTEVKKIYAEVESCTECNGSGEIKKGDCFYPCEKCRGGWRLK